jgi:hypothetical protein
MNNTDYTVYLCQNPSCGARMRSKAQFCAHCNTPEKRRAADEENLKIRAQLGLSLDQV